MNEKRKRRNREKINILNGENTREDLLKNKTNASQYVKHQTLARHELNMVDIAVKRSGKLRKDQVKYDSNDVESKAPYSELLNLSPV